MTDTLLARLEAATEGNWLLDSEIAATIHGMLDQDWRDPRWHEGGPKYSSSLDAALTLVPKNWDWIISRITMLAEMRVGYTAVLEQFIGRGEPDDPYRMESKCNGVGSTPAIALCIAALKARETDQ